MEEIRNGMFTASRIGDLLAKGQGKTAHNYIFEIAEGLVGAKKDVRTKAMEHGIINERTAIDILVSIVGGRANTNANGEQVFYKVNDKLGATPDAIGEDYVGDSKCQYEIINFVEQNEKIPKKYYAQLQVQMMALKVEKGYLINYLTKPEIWGQDEWTEYPFELNERHHIHTIAKDEAMQDDILNEVEKKHPLIGLCVEMLLNATELNEIDFFYNQLISKTRYSKLKELNWIANDKEVFRFKDTFYVAKKLPTNTITIQDENLKVIKKVPDVFTSLEQMMNPMDDINDTFLK